MYKQETLQEEKERISRSLGAFKDIKILSKVLDFAMSVSYFIFIKIQCKIQYISNHHEFIIYGILYTHTLTHAQVLVDKIYQLRMK